MHKTLEMLKEYFVRLVRNDLQMINLKLSNDQIKFDFKNFRDLVKLNPYFTLELCC